MPKKRTAENEIVVPASAAVPTRRKPVSRPRMKRSLEPVDTIVASTTESAAPVIETKGGSAAKTPTYQEIAALAYSFWEARGCQGGSPEEDWLRAERQLRMHVSAVVA